MKQVLYEKADEDIDDLNVHSDGLKNEDEMPYTQLPVEIRLSQELFLICNVYLVCVCVCEGGGGGVRRVLIARVYIIKFCCAIRFYFLVL